jgi:hypothetical protein
MDLSEFFTGAVAFVIVVLWGIALLVCWSNALDHVRSMPDGSMKLFAKMIFNLATMFALLLLL